MTVQPSSAGSRELRRDLATRVETTPVDGKFGTRLFAMSDAERDLVVRLLRSDGAAQATPETPPCPRCSFPYEPGAAERYWEARWRDEKAENDRLRAATQAAPEPAPKTIMEAAASAADKISLWSNSKQGYANRIVPQPTQGGDKGEPRWEYSDGSLFRDGVNVFHFRFTKTQAELIAELVRDANAALQPASNAYSSRTWDVALSERVMQFETAGVYKLSCKQILGLIAFVRDGEGSVVTSTSRKPPETPGFPNYWHECQCDHPLIKCDNRGCNCTICGLPERRTSQIRSTDRGAG